MKPSAVFGLSFVAVAFIGFAAALSGQERDLLVDVPEDSVITCRMAENTADVSRITPIVARAEPDCDVTVGDLTVR